MNKAADLQYLKTQRGAEIRAGLQGYTGHLSKAELARRMEIYNRIMREMDEEIMEEESYEDQAGVDAQGWEDRIS